MTGSPPMVLPSAMASLWRVSTKSGEASSSRRKTVSRRGIGQLDADGVAPRRHRHARRNRRHRPRNVVRKPDHPRRLDPRRRLEIVQGDDRAGENADNIALDAEILQDPFEKPRVLLQRILIDRPGDLLPLGEKIGRGKDVGRVGAVTGSRVCRDLLTPFFRARSGVAHPVDPWPRRRGEINETARSALIAGFERLFECGTQFIELAAGDLPVAFGRAPVHSEQVFHDIAKGGTLRYAAPISGGGGKILRGPG